MLWIAMIINKAYKALNIIIKRPAGYREFFLDYISALSKKSRALGLPVHFGIEPTNICNLRCPVCETGAGILKRDKGMMSLSDFKKIIDKIHSHANSIIFYFMGEPFLNPDSYEMIKYARQKRIFISVCTNGELVEAEKLVDAEPNEISFQISGTDQESHQAYRVGSDLGKVLNNIRACLDVRKRAGKLLPRIVIGFILMKQNESEVEDARRMSKEMGVDELRIQEACVRTVEQGKRFLPSDDKYWIYDKGAFDKGLLRPRVVCNNRCDWIYFSMVILWNGDCVPCCRDSQGEYVVGNILKEELGAMWNGKKMTEFRELIKKDQKQMQICRLCSGFTPTLYY